MHAAFWPGSAGLAANRIEETDEHATEPDRPDDEDCARVLYRPVTRDTSDLSAATRMIRVLVHYSRSEFFVANGRPAGFEHTALMEFEKFLNHSRGKKAPKVSLTFIPVHFKDLIPYLIEGKGDIAAGFLTVTGERAAKVAFTKAYLRDVSEVLVGHAGSTLPESLEDLSGRTVHAMRGSSFVEHLGVLNDRFMAAGRPQVNVVEMPPSATDDDILEMVNAGIFSLTAVDGFIAELWSQVLPDIRVLHTIGLNRGGNIAWAVRKDNPEFLKKLDAFVERNGLRLRAAGAAAMKRHFKDAKLLANPLSQEAFGLVKELSPHFREASAKSKLDWLMMMAQGFQESGLNQNLRSPRGAVGIMQVLPETAKSIGFRDITKVRQNIAAGVAYLDFIRRTYFNDPGIPPDARVDFALAAYNAGPNRIQALRQTARTRGLDPNLWFNNVERVALDRVGEEPVRYVANVNRYYIAYRMAHHLDEERRELRSGPTGVSP
jgi:membrane-bound lytic murein transglycosylase MltF